ncbi:hypothetical protein BH11BAC6_BH11BAC6_13520 [soil metagenome]
MMLYHKYEHFKESMPFEMVLRYSTIKGSVVYMLCKASITEWSHDGIPLEMKGCHVNITASQNPDNAKEQNKMIIEGVNAGIWDYDVRKDKLWCSDKLYQMLGYYPGEVKASFHNFFNEMLHPDDRQKTLDLLEAHFKNDASYINDIRLKHKEGTYRWFESAGKAKFNRSRKAIRMVGSLIDKEQRRRLHLELESYQFLINESTVLIKASNWEINFTTDTVMWSPGMYDIHETEQGFKPYIRNLFQFLQEKDTIIFKKLLKEAYRNGTSYDAEFESVTAKGNLKWIRIIGKPVIDSEGKITTIRGITQDIHNQKLKDTQIENSIALITAKNNSLNNFAQIVSHNLRSHASNMEAILNLINNESDPVHQKEMIGYLKKISGNLNQTIEHLAETIKVQNNAALPKNVRILNDVIKEVTDVLRPTIQETNAEINYIEGYKEIEYVPAYLESIILNLVSNAIKYRKPGTKPVLHLKTYIEDDRKHLSVTDNGLGIDLDKNGSDLFGMYKTFHENADAVGIGLYITRQQVESLGGKIAVSSKPGEGTTFDIQF